MTNKEILTRVREIKKWYWKYGKDWDLKSRISPSILLELNKLDNSLRMSLNKDTVPIWGPSQSGKSVFVSKIVDYYNDTDYDSAISWDENDKILLSKNPDFFTVDQELPKIFNNYNNGADSTISATRFYLPENPNSVDMNFPATVLIGSRENILQTISEGYLYSIEKMHDYTTDIDADYLEELLNTEYNDINSDESIDEESFNLISDLINVIDNLIFLNRRRFIKLKANNSWSYLRERILTNKILNSNSEAALGFIQTVLWNNNQEINSILKSILVTYDEINQKLGTKKLVCKVDVASKLSSLSIKTNEAGGSNEEYFQLQENQNELIVTLTRTTKDEKFKLSNLHAIIFEVQIPLREEILQKISQESVEFFKKCDLLDLPGGTIIHQQINEDLQIERDEIIKRGRTSSIIFNYAETLQFSSILLNIKTAKKYDLEGITQGIELIYSKLDDSYYNKIKMHARDKEGITSTPIPLQIIFSFFNTAWDNFLANYNNSDKGKSSLDNYETFLSGKVDFLHPSNAYSLATNYYWFRGGTSALVDRNFKILKEEFKYNNWFNNRFILDGEKESVTRLIANQKSGDGGVSYILGATLEILTMHSNRVDRNEIFKSRLDNIISLITPTDLSDKEKINSIYAEFIEKLENRLTQYQEDDIEDHIDDILMFSKNLRDLRNFDSRDIEYIPNIDISSQNFYNKIINKWIEKRITIITALGCDQGKSKIIAEVLAEKITDTKSIQKYIEDIFKDAHSKPNVKTLHRLIAKYFAHRLRNTLREKNLSIEDTRKKCEDIFKKCNGENKKKIIANMHLTNTIEQHLRELKAIKANLSHSTSKLDGIAELEKVTNLVSQGAEDV